MRTFLYHETALNGRIFTSQADVDSAKMEGWVEAPWMVGKEAAKTPSEPEPAPVIEDAITDNSLSNEPRKYQIKDR